MGKGAGTHHWTMHAETFYGVKVDISGGFDAKHMAATLRAFAKAHMHEVDWSKKTAKELQWELEDRGLPKVPGNKKSEMVKALEEHDAAEEGVAEPLNPVHFLLPENGTAPPVHSYDFSIFSDRRSLTHDMDQAEKAWKGAAEALDCDGVNLLFFGNGGGDGWPPQATLELFLIAEGLTTSHKTKLDPDSGWGVGSTPIKMPSAEGQTQMDEELRTIMDTFGLKGDGPGLHLLSNAQDLGWG